MKVLVTGYAGFLGRAVCANLAGRGCEVVGFDTAPADDVDGVTEVILGDIRDASAVRDAVRSCDGVINLAGVLGTSELWENVVGAVRTNIEGAVNLFEAVREKDRSMRVVQTSMGNWHWPSPYSITKEASHRFAFAYNSCMGMKIAVIRPANAYGPWQKHYPVEKLVPQAIRAAFLREPMRVFWTGEQRVDMVYVGDVAELAVRALLVDHGVYGSLLEIGNGYPVTVNRVVDMIWEIITGEPTAPKRHVPMRPGEPEDEHWPSDITTLAPLGPFTFTNLEVGLLATCAWYKEHPEYVGLQKAPIA